MIERFQLFQKSFFIHFFLNKHDFLLKKIYLSFTICMNLDRIETILFDGIFKKFIEMDILYLLNFID
jgi:hypothetical protein